MELCRRDSIRGSRTLDRTKEEACSSGPDQMSNPSVFKFLAIDDDPQDLGLIVEALSQEGLEILTAGDSEAGFELFLQTRPKTVVLSLARPESQGMDLLERLVRADPAVNVILIADHSSKD